MRHTRRDIAQDYVEPEEVSGRELMNFTNTFDQIPK